MLTELPVELLDLIFVHLDVSDFLALCGTCKAFHQPSIRLDDGYWSSVTRRQFRLPNRPAIDGHGKRWQALYKRLLTQTAVYTWGQGGRSSWGSLGRPTERVRNSVPKQIDHAKQLGIIADMQCGGWSTSYLTSNGVLHFAGTMDGDRLQTSKETEMRGWTNPLQFPKGFASTDDLKRSTSNNPLLPITAIRQFSSGRKHVLGLSDSGRIWSWYSHAEPALHIKFPLTDIREQGSTQNTSRGSVRQVVAGWDKSSAYVSGTGIVIWEIARRSRNSSAEEEDTQLVLSAITVPLSGHSAQKTSQRQSRWQSESESDIGSVVSWVLLEHFVVFLTDIGKVFAARTESDEDTTLSIDHSVELKALRNSEPYPEACDIHGSFRSFAVLMNGQVSVLSQFWLEQHWDPNAMCIEAPLPPRALIPALQNTGVQQVAFGDWHFHALHNDGTITSYGKEPSRCGALGLGGPLGDVDCLLRGLKSHRGMDTALVPHAYLYGRRVWFEPEKHEWLHFLTYGGANVEEASERLQIIQSTHPHLGELSEWVEQQGTQWEQHAETGMQNSGDDALEAYFALSVSAAGWHSGALVLVNEDLTEKLKARGSFWENDSFPRLKLSDGTEMSGTIPFSIWKKGRPEFDESQLQLWSAFP